MIHQNGPPEREEPGATHSTGPNQALTDTTTNTADSIALAAFAVGLAGADLPVLPLLPRTSGPGSAGRFTTRPPIPTL